MNTSDVLRAIRASCAICNGTGIDSDEQDCRVCGDPMRAVMRAARGKPVVAKDVPEATPATTDRVVQKFIPKPPMPKPAPQNVLITECSQRVEAKPAAEATAAPTDDELIRCTNCQAVPELGGGIRVTWAHNDERYALNVGQFGLCVRAGNYICIIHPPIARLVARHIRRIHGE